MICVKIRRGEREVRACGGGGGRRGIWSCRGAGAAQLEVLSGAHWEGRRASLESNRA